MGKIIFYNLFYNSIVTLSIFKDCSKRDKSLQLRMSEEELHLLDKCSKRLNISRTDVVNKGIKLVKKELDAKK